MTDVQPDADPDAADIHAVAADSTDAADADAVAADSTDADAADSTDAAVEAARATAAATGPTAAEPATTAPGRRARKVREGVVVSNRMDRTAVVAVIERVRHPKYGKFVQRTKKLYAHDAANDVGVGDRVRLMETRPISKLKRWRVVEVLERAR